MPEFRRPVPLGELVEVSELGNNSKRLVIKRVDFAKYFGSSPVVANGMEGVNDGESLGVETQGEAAVKDKLFPAQQAVLECLAQGLSNGEIARRKIKSIKTVKSQISALHSRLGSEDSIVTVFRGIEAGLLDFDTVLSYYNPDTMEQLSKTETKVMRTIIMTALDESSVPDRVIAKSLTIEEKTLKTHLGNIYAKFGVSSRLQATFGYLKFLDTLGREADVVFSSLRERILHLLATDVPQTSRKPRSRAVFP